MLDQAYVAQTLPPVSSMGIQSLLKRRLNRDMANQEIRGALLLGREKTGRKDWLAMMIALERTPAVNKWLDLIMEQPNRLAGIYLVPVEAQSYIKRIQNKIDPVKKNKKTKELKDSNEEKWDFLVSHHKTGGFRQVILRNGVLALSRLTQPIGDSSPEVTAGNVEQEIQQTIEFMKRLGYHESAQLHILAVVAQSVKSLIDTSRIKFTRLNVFTPFEIAGMLKLEGAAAEQDMFADVVLAVSIATANKKNSSFPDGCFKEG